MASIFRNPKLQDYFVDVPEVRAQAPVGELPSIVELYEAGKVITFSRLDLGIDHDFWAELTTESYPQLKKLKSQISADLSSDPMMDAALAAAGLPAPTEAAVRAEARRLCERVFPIYEQVFSGYRFKRRKAVWRLNTTMNENLHLDCYKSPQTEHFARMFINLDNQPRIWQTSYSASELYDRYFEQIPREVAEAGDENQIHASVSAAAFGDQTQIWWDGQPRHVIYFQPGDVWAVDSRQISHQIFYGRRALSIDFLVELDSMMHPERHYLALARRFRKEVV